MSPENTPPSTPNFLDKTVANPNNITVVANRKVHGTRAVIFLILGLVVLLVGIGSAVIIGRNPQRIKTESWDCLNYFFNVSQTGQVTTTNHSAIEEPAQKVNVSINGQQVATLDVPKVAPGEIINIGQVQVPPDGVFTWDTIGIADCANHGSYEVAPTSTPVPPTPIPETELPTPTIPKTTITPSPTPISPTSTPPPNTPTIPPNTPTPTTVIPSSTSVPHTTETPAPGQLNSCNGTCGSNSNCQSNLICSAGFCRNPNCSGSDSCACAPTGVPSKASVPSPSPTSGAPPAQLLQSGDSTLTWIVFLSGLLITGFGALLIF